MHFKTRLKTCLVNVLLFSLISLITRVIYSISWYFTFLLAYVIFCSSVTCVSPVSDKFVSRARRM